MIELGRGGGSEQARSQSDEYANLIAEEILNNKALNEDEQTDLIRQLELNTF